MHCDTGKSNLFIFLLDTRLEKPGSNETLTAAETTPTLISEDYPQASMIEDLKNPNTICSPDVSRIGKEIKAIELKNFSYPKRKFGKEERSFWPV